MKILYVMPVAFHGGAEKIVVSLADHMVSKGHQVVVVALKGPIKMQSKGIQIQELGLSNILKLPFSFFKLLLIYYRFKPDIVHSHIIYSHLFCRFAKFFYFKKHILFSSEHCTITNAKIGFFKKILFKITNFLSDNIYNVSNEGVCSYEKENLVSIGQMKCIYNGVDLEKFKIVNQIYSKSDFLGQEHDLLFLAVGRLHFQKDYINLLEALTYYKKKFNSKFKCLIVGEGPQEQILKQKCADFGILDNVDFLGVRNDVNYLMKLCDVYILSSLFEGLPTVLIEALSSPCLIASTDCGGSKEILDGITDVVPVQNPIELSNKINALVNLSNVDKRILLEKSSQKAEELFSDKTMKHNWYKEYLDHVS